MPFLIFVCTVCVFFSFFFFLCVRVYPPQTSSQLQEAKQLERERHRQHSPVTPHTEPESPQLHTHIHLPAKSPGREANGPVTPPTPSGSIPPTPSTPSTPAPEASSSTPASQEPVEQEEQGPVYESPDPENGSDFCVAENEQTEADQATAAAAAAQSETAYIGPFFLYTIFISFLFNFLHGYFSTKQFNHILLQYAKQD